MVSPEFFKNFAISSFYKYILYIAGIILILSLFIETKGIESLLVQKASLYCIFLGIALWILDVIKNQIMESLHEKRSNLDNIIFTMCIFWFLVIFGTVITFLLIFKLVF